MIKSQISNLPTLIFLLGPAYSGSTLVAAMLGTAPGFLNLGELSYAEKDFKSDTVCLCGAPLCQCKIWAPLARLSQERILSGSSFLNLSGSATPHPFDRPKKSWAVRISNAFEKFKNFLDIDSSTRKYQNANSTFLKEVKLLTGADFVIDSSKNLTRLSALSQIDGLKVKVLYIDRKSGPLLKSHISRKRKRSEYHSPFLVPSYWLILSLRRFYIWICWRRVAKENRASITLEEILSDPRLLEAKVAKLLDRDFSILMDDDRCIPLAGQHVFSGNRWLRTHAGHKSVQIRNSGALHNSSQSDRGSDPIEHKNGASGCV